VINIIYYLALSIKYPVFKVSFNRISACFSHRIHLVGEGEI
jgi:hypothetical protein